jgi:hypothetical protein
VISAEIVHDVLAIDLIEDLNRTLLGQSPAMTRVVCWLPGLLPLLLNSQFENEIERFLLQSIHGPIS